MKDSETMAKFLTIKRLEIPPPGYFQHFADQVIARIEHNQQLGPSGFLRGMLGRIDPRPLLACTLGAAMAALMPLALVSWTPPAPLIHAHRPQHTANPWLTAAAQTLERFEINQSISSKSGSSVDPVIHFPRRSISRLNNPSAAWYSVGYSNSQE